MKYGEFIVIAVLFGIVISVETSVITRSARSESNSFIAFAGQPEKHERNYVCSLSPETAYKLSHHWLLFDFMGHGKYIWTPDGQWPEDWLCHVWQERTSEVNDDVAATAT